MRFSVFTFWAPSWLWFTAHRWHYFLSATMRTHIFNEWISHNRSPYTLHSYFGQLPPAGCFVPKFLQTFHTLSSNSQNPPTIFFGAMALFAGSYQYLQNAQHREWVFTLKVFIMRLTPPQNKKSPPCPGENQHTPILCMPIFSLAETNAIIFYIFLCIQKLHYTS